MLTTKNTFLYLLLNAITFSVFALEDDHAHAGHGAHIHGEAELLVAYENNQLQIAFNSPAGNLLGFEYRAQTAEEITAVENAEALLNVPEEMYAISGAECKAAHVSVDTSAVKADEKGHKHSHGHDHGHDHDEHTDEEHSESHAEISAEYHYECGGGSISAIDVLMLNAFTGIETLNAQWVTGINQGASQLNQNNITLVMAE